MIRKETLRTILLIDDDEAINFIHKLVIQATRADVTTKVCYNGLEGIELLTKNNQDNIPQPGIIFLDINMPQMNGWEFIKAFQRLPFDTTGIRVVAMVTTSLNPDDEKRARENFVVSDFLQKPLSTKQVLQIMNEHFVTT